MWANVLPCGHVLTCGHVHVDMSTWTCPRNVLTCGHGMSWHVDMSWYGHVHVDMSWHVDMSMWTWHVDMSTWTCQHVKTYFIYYYFLIGKNEKVPLYSIEETTVCILWYTCPCLWQTCPCLTWTCPHVKTFYLFIYFLLEKKERSHCDSIDMSITWFGKNYIFYPYTMSNEAYHQNIVDSMLSIQICMLDDVFFMHFGNWAMWHLSKE